MRRLVTGLCVLIALAFVGLAGLGGWLYWNHVEIRGEQLARAELAPLDSKDGLAAKQVTAFFDYDFQTVERSLKDAYTMLTPDYRKEFEERANAEIIPQARERELVSQANVVGVGVIDAHRDSATVMVYLNRTVTDKSKQPLYDGSRLRVDYQRIDGKWLINYIQPI